MTTGETDCFAHAQLRRRGLFCWAGAHAPLWQRGGGSRALAHLPRGDVRGEGGGFWKLPSALSRGGRLVAFARVCGEGGRERGAADMGVTHGAGGSPQDPCGGGLPNGDQ